MHTNTVHVFHRPRPRAHTHRRHQQLLDLVDGPLEFDLGPVVRVLHCDQDVEVLAEVLPVGLPPVHLLLGDRTGLFEMHGHACPVHTGGEGLCFSSPLARGSNRALKVSSRSRPAAPEGYQTLLSSGYASRMSRFVEGPRTPSLRCFFSHAFGGESAASLIFRRGLVGNKSASRRGTVNSR